MSTPPAFPDPQRAWAYRPPQPLRGAATGPLAGLTFSVKDLFAVEGWPLRASTRAPLPLMVPSPLVLRLLDLGALPWARPTCTRSPWGFWGRMLMAGLDTLPCRTMLRAGAAVAPQ
ncbi:hypothetical protein [Deinococcus radiophilus]|uniref:hypothetical protein n=1 Tax=Deinococcus radiophilus TaxID=32062 RepID=UPI003615BF5F